MKPRPFTTFQIEPTSRCQPKCIMCSRAAFADEWISGDMPFSVNEKLSRYFNLVKDIHLQGWGEPVRNQMPEVCKTCYKSYGI